MHKRIFTFKYWLEAKSGLIQDKREIVLTDIK
jgi:hypothetical protein